MGTRVEDDVFCIPDFDELNINFIPVLSRSKNEWTGEMGYVQDIVLKQKINLNDVKDMLAVH